MKLKEPLAGALHLIGAIAVIPATIILIVLGSSSAWKVVSFSIYGASFFLPFHVSALFTLAPVPRVENSRFFRKLDHLAIYLVIAGTYTPFCLNTLRGPWDGGYWHRLGRRFSDNYPVDIYKCMEMLQH